MSKHDPKVFIDYVRLQTPDGDPDLSWLDQSDKEMGEGFEAQSALRKEAYQRGDWEMIAIRAQANIRIERDGCSTLYTLQSPGLWGIESDSDDAYLTEVFKEECATLRADIEALKEVQS